MPKNPFFINKGPFSLKDIVNECGLVPKSGYKKILVVTGKGSRSRSYDNPYLSEKLSVLKYAVPEYINNDENLINKIRKISQADLKDGGEGAIYIFLKN